MLISPTPTTDRRTPSSRAEQLGGVLLSRPDFDALLGELNALRREVAGTRAVRSGDPQHDAAVATGATDLLASLASAGVERRRIEQVEDLIQRASKLDGVAAQRGGAGVGSLVRVADRGGRESTYEITPRGDADPPQRVTPGSAEGEALLGARAGDYMQITHGNGRRRRVRVLEVQPRGCASQRTAFEAA